MRTLRMQRLLQSAAIFRYCLPAFCVKTARPGCNFNARFNKIKVCAATPYTTLAIFSLDRAEENPLFNLKKLFTVLSTKVLAGSLALSPVNADGCTRVVYLGPNADVITARSMDWNSDIATNLWIFPKGMERSGEAGRNSLRWTSKYGSVIASGFDVADNDRVTPIIKDV